MTNNYANSKQNNNIEKQIIIFEGYQDNSWLFSVQTKNDLLSVDTSVSKEECIKIAENIDYY